MLDVDDMVMVKVPDAKSIMTFLVTIYQHFNSTPEPGGNNEHQDSCVFATLSHFVSTFETILCNWSILQ